MTPNIPKTSQITIITKQTLIISIRDYDKHRVTCYNDYI